MFTVPNLLCAALSVGIYSLGASAWRESNVVDLGYVKYRGNVNASFPNTVSYLGIPYAEPPLGNLRFRAPVPLNKIRVSAEARGEVVDATEYPEFCVQGSTSGEAGGAGSEDCLKVNVYAPEGAKPGDDLPVLFYIHGGGYIYGNPAAFPFEHWISQSPNVIIVSVYYRLDSFGFLAVPEFSNPLIGDFNAGFQDQTQALRWVQENIWAFGGDPSRVTINGESAGGGSVEFHLVATDQEGLFSGAIAQSVYRSYTITPEQMQPLFDFYSDAAGCGTGSVPEKVNCLRNATVSALARAQDMASSSFNGSYNIFIPIADGKIITGPPTLSLEKGEFWKVPVIVGSTSNESVVYSGSVSDGVGGLWPGLTQDDLQEFEEEYPLSDFDDAIQQVSTATGEPLFRCAPPIIANATSKTHKAWIYRFDQPNPTLNVSFDIGVAHAAENWFEFRGTNTG
ncbi:hypothetical protein VKT23_008236 [Stygiomarasmius scandens]